MTVDAPARPGAYVLAIELARPIELRLRGKAAALATGCYLYCGSAKGPGGLRARIARHARRGKAIHWHIDSLTEAGTVLAAWAFPGADECDLAAALAHLPVPIACFGNTDCRQCRSHLFQWPADKATLLRKGLSLAIARARRTRHCAACAPERNGSG